MMQSYTGTGCLRECLHRLKFEIFSGEQAARRVLDHALATGLEIFPGCGKRHEIGKAGQDFGTACALGHKVGSTQGTRAFPLFFGFFTRNHDKRHIHKPPQLGRSHSLQQAKTVEFRHLQIGNDRPNRIIENQLLPCRFTITFFANLVMVFQTPDQRHPHQA